MSSVPKKADKLNMSLSPPPSLSLFLSLSLPLSLFYMGITSVNGNHFWKSHDDDLVQYFSFMSVWAANPHFCGCNSEAHLSIRPSKICVMQTWGMQPLSVHLFVVPKMSFCRLQIPSYQSDCPYNIMWICVDLGDAPLLAQLLVRLNGVHLSYSRSLYCM